MKLLKVRQRGVIFLALVLVLVVTGGTLMLGAMNNRQTATLAQGLEVRYQMEIAKQALIAYSKYADDYYGTIMSPGLLPCPDVDGDGASDSDCDPATEYLGRLPQYVEMPYTGLNGKPARFYLSEANANIDLGDPDANIEQQFWYAVSPNFLRIDTESPPLPVGSNQSGTLTLDGTTDIVAVIIAPGEVLDDQNRALNPDNYAEYLDGGNGVNQNFRTSYEANPAAFNDTVLAITSSDIRNSLTYGPIAEKIKTRLDAYYVLCGYYPRAYRTTLCVFNAGITTNGAAFRNWLNAAGNTVTWTKETGSGGDNWVAASAMTYTYVDFDTSTVNFKQVGTAECIRFRFEYTLLPAITQSTVASC